MHAGRAASSLNLVPATGTAQTTVARQYPAIRTIDMIDGSES